MNEEGTDLPTEIADRLTRPFARFLKIKVATGVMLFVATIAALILSNSKWSMPFSAFWEIPIGLHFGSLDFTRSLRLCINEGLMTLFFFVVALELKRSLAHGNRSPCIARNRASSSSMRSSRSSARAAPARLTPRSRCR